MAQRYVVTFPTLESLRAALASDLGEIKLLLTNEERLYAALEVPPAVATSEPSLFSIPLFAHFSDVYGATTVADYQYSPESTYRFDDIYEVEETELVPGLPEVRRMVHAEEAWRAVAPEKARGKGVTIAIVDTGVAAGRLEFPEWKRVSSIAFSGDDPWTDDVGHGTMCAAIATATSSDGGLFDGIAPDAYLMSCKTTFYDSDLALIYDCLRDKARSSQTRIIACNSFGVDSTTEPDVPSSNVFPKSLDDAMAAGVVPVFSAGNNHPGAPHHCGPNTIWLYKSDPRVLAVAACDLSGTLWDYSSRGPGQGVLPSARDRKPDVTCPTPAHGRIPWGNRIVAMPQGWGTSGTGAQVAGLLALLLAKRPAASPSELLLAVRSRAAPLPYCHECAGHGLIDCMSSLDAI